MRVAELDARLIINARVYTYSNALDLPYMYGWSKVLEHSWVHASVLRASVVALKNKVPCNTIGVRSQSPDACCWSLQADVHLVEVIL
eukprot:1146415-Pelagomonas_calceolata.AAC.2